MKRVICLILVLVMAATMFVSCVQDPGEDTPTTDASTTKDPNVTADPNVTTQELPADVSEMKEKNIAEEKVLYVLHWNSEHKEFDMTREEANGDPVNDAIYERNNQVINALGLTRIDWTEQKGSTGNEAAFLQYVDTVSSSGDIPLDVIATYSRSAGLLSQKGHLLPLNFYDKHIDFSHTWYPEKLVEEVNIGGNTYFVSGDVSTNLLYLTYGFIFNKDVMEENNLDYNNLYTLVEEGKWTLDEMFKLVSDFGSDANQNGKKDEADSFGLRSYNYHLDSIYTGSGLNLVEVNNDTTDPSQLITISDDYGSQKAIDLNDRIGSLFTSDAAINDESTAGNFAKYQNTIAEITRIRDIRKMFEEGIDEMSYGVLPLPKYDTNQEDYRCVAGNPFTLYGIYSGNLDLEAEEVAAAYIEYAGFYGQMNTTPAIFEDLFKGRYSEFPEDAASFDIIRRTTAFDIGRIFTKVISPNAAIADQWSNCAAKGGKWATTYTRQIRTYAQNAQAASNDFWALKESFKNPYEVPYDQQ